MVRKPLYKSTLTTRSVVIFTEFSSCKAIIRYAYDYDDGYLCAVRICDYAGHEHEIDWTKTPVSKEQAYSINLVDEFPKGCGMKPQIED